MRDTPIHLNGPFTLKLEQQAAWVIRGRDGVSICELTTKLIDGSRRIEKYPDGMIRSKQAREEEAKFVLNALNAALSGHRLFPANDN
jgi:hypothetical protein